MLLVLIILIVLMLASAPWPGYPRPYGWYPSGIVGVLLVVLLVLLIAGMLPPPRWGW